MAVKRPLGRGLWIAIVAAAVAGGSFTAVHLLLDDDSPMPAHATVTPDPLCLSLGNGISSSFVDTLSGALRRGVELRSRSMSAVSAGPDKTSTSRLLRKLRSGMSLRS